LPKRPGPDGRLRVALFGPTLHGGGAEEWQRLLIRTLDRSRIALVGVGVPDRRQANGDIADQFRAMVPVHLGGAACRELAADVDVALCWGIDRLSRIMPLLSPWPVTIMTSHMDTRHPWDLRVHAQPRIDRQAAVSELALAPIPVGQWGGTSILPNGIEEERLVPTRDALELRAELGIPRNAPVLGFVGRPQGDQKDPFALARALPHLPGWHALFVGAWRPGRDPVWAEIQSQIGPRATFTGNRRDLGNMFSLMTRLVIPSRWECFCLVAAEACAFGIPTLMTHTGIAQYHPHWFAPIPMDANGGVLASLILSDCEDHRATERARVARDECRSLYGSAAFGERWSRWLLEIGAERMARREALA
jgi:glycosyltransferase involved in cell wall biosynthesis